MSPAAPGRRLLPYDQEVIRARRDRRRRCLEGALVGLLVSLALSFLGGIGWLALRAVVAGD